MAEIRLDENGKLKCSLEYALTMIAGKWKPVILWHLGTEKVLRYNELRRYMPGITHKMLSQKLKELQEECLINRVQYNEMPPKVEYSLTSKGESVMPILEELHKWGTYHWNNK